jgi:RNA-directed DNA polymerase
LAKKSIQQEIHGWRMHLKTTKTLEELSYTFNPILIGWVNYYGLFYKSELYCVFQNLNNALIRWAQRKYKKLSGRKQRASGFLGKIARHEPNLFIHWKMGIFPGAG